MEGCSPSNIWSLDQRADLDRIRFTIRGSTSKLYVSRQPFTFFVECMAAIKINHPFFFPIYHCSYYLYLLFHLCFHLNVFTNVLVYKFCFMYVWLYTFFIIDQYFGEGTGQSEGMDRNVNNNYNNNFAFLLHFVFWKQHHQTIYQPHTKC